MNNKGLTLIELLAGITIMAIMAVIAVPSVYYIVEKAKKDVCEVNREQLEKNYESHLKIENVAHEELIFKQFTEDYYDTRFCPSEGAIRYELGGVKCSVHQDKEEVPYL